MEKYDRMLQHIKSDGWTPLKLITHTPISSEEMVSKPKSASDNGTDGKLSAKEIKDRYGIKQDEFDRMYAFAQELFVATIQVRLKR